VDAAVILHTVRERAGISRRELARRAGTSPATLAAYEAGRITPSVATLERIVHAAGFEVELDLLRRVEPLDRGARGRELADALEVAAQFPARHAPRIEYPRFGAA
jgi:transcriptional regulator with XRE-family HTH domain